jgi:hypothetical protein
MSASADGLGTRIHEFACPHSIAPVELADGRAKHDMTK